MKRKFLLPILSVCMVVALVSVGFAAWLITGSDTSDTATGSFVTDSLNNAYFSVYVDFNADTPEADKGKIIFGKDGTPSTPWLDASTVPVQKMAATATVYIVPEQNDYLSDISGLLAANGSSKVVLTLTIATNGAALATCIDKGYVVSPTMVATDCTPSGSITVNAAKDNVEGSVVLTMPASVFTTTATYNAKSAKSANVTITFAWGSNGNPYTYLNGLTGGNTPENRATATTMLNAINGLNAGTYNLALSLS